MKPKLIKQSFRKNVSKLSHSHQQINVNQMKKF